MNPVASITLGVEGLTASAEFYARIGFKKGPSSDERIVWGSTGGTMMGLYPGDSLAEGASVRPRCSGFRGVALSHSLSSIEAVDSLYQTALAAGATPVTPPQPVGWGRIFWLFLRPRRPFVGTGVESVPHRRRYGHIFRRRQPVVCLLSIPAAIAMPRMSKKYPMPLGPYVIK